MTTDAFYSEPPKRDSGERGFIGWLKSKTTNGFYSTGRLLFFTIIMTAGIGAIMAKFASLMFQPAQPTAVETQIRERGSILDRNGKVLAIQTKVYNLGVDPKKLREENYDIFAQILSPIIGIGSREISDKLKATTNSFTYIKKKISQSEADDVLAAVAAANIHGIRLEETTTRAYPENSMAAQLIGFVGSDNTGLAGIEHSLDSTLAPPQNSKLINDYGNNVLLTIDSNLQYKLEQLAKSAMETTQAESMMLLAAEAKTGEILTYISLPSPNLNEYPSSTEAQRLNRPIGYSYEPGSVFKIFSVASFLDAGVISPDEKFVCDGVFEVRTKGEVVRINCLDHHGTLTAREALKYSCNDALAQMSQKINAEYFLAQIHNLGFGSIPEIELEGKSAGSVKDTQDKFWSARSKPTIAIGQEISVTAVQMVQAATALANGGVPVPLTVVSKIVDKEDNVIYQHVPKPMPQIIKKSTADYVLSCMETTAKSGTGSRANISDINIGVKTGTAQMLDEVHGGYSSTDFLSSCISVFPIEDPEIILYIVITKAKGETYGGRIVAPIIHDAANVIIDYLGMQRDRAISINHPGKITIPQDRPVAIATYMPDLTGYPKRLLTPLLSRTDLQITIKGDGWVVSQNPPPGTPVTENMAIELTLE